MGKGKRVNIHTPTISPKQDIATRIIKSGADTSPPALDGEVPPIASENPTIYGNSEEEMANVATQSSITSCKDIYTKEISTHKEIPRQLDHDSVKKTLVNKIFEQQNKIAQIGTWKVSSITREKILAEENSLLDDLFLKLDNLNLGDDNFNREILQVEDDIMGSDDIDNNELKEIVHEISNKPIKENEKVGQRELTDDQVSKNRLSVPQTSIAPMLNIPSSMAANGIQPGTFVVLTAPCLKELSISEMSIFIEKRSLYEKQMTQMHQPLVRCRDTIETHILNQIVRTYNKGTAFDIKVSNDTISDDQVKQVLIFMKQPTKLAMGIMDYHSILKSLRFEIAKGPKIAIYDYFAQAEKLVIENGLAWCR